ncbi:MAG: hypothetical protein RSI33_07110, partial [Clostridia bacterium]
VEVPFEKGLAVTVATTACYENSELTAFVGELEVGGVVEVKSRNADALEISAVLTEGSLSGFVSATDIRPLTAEEIAIYEANPTPVAYTAMEAMDMSAMLFSLPGAVILTNGTPTPITLPAYAGSGSDRFASFSMTTSGLLTITFKSTGIASGNIKLKIADANDAIELWTGSLVPNGTTNFSMFVEAGDYDITMSKSDIGDAAPYSLIATPMISLTGEAGIKNNTQNNAATLPLNSGTPITGIYSAQDLNKTRIDFYRLDLASAGKLTLSATNLVPGQLDVLIYGDDTSTGNVIATMNINVGAASENNGITIHRSGWFDAGTYYIMVTNKTADGRYRLQADLATVALTEKEPNSTPSQAYSSGSWLSLNNVNYVNGLLSESDLRDYYCFFLPAAGNISASVKAQLANLNLYICNQSGDKVASSDFGGLGSGSYGNPYEYELKNLILPAGYYYLCAERLSATSDTGLYAVRAYSSLMVSSVSATVSGSSGNINTVKVSAIATGGVAPLRLHRFAVYFVEGSNMTQVLTRDSKTPDMTFTLNRAGTYQIQYVCNDGATWAEGWSSPFVVQVVPLKVETLSARPTASGQIVCEATVSGANPITQCSFSLYKNNVLVDQWFGKNSLQHTFDAPVSGSYSIQYAITDGYLWVDGWTTCSATVPLPLTITSLNVSVDNNGNVVGRSTIQNGFPLQQGIYYVYNSNQQVIASRSTTALQSNFRITTKGDYLMQFVASDGRTWTDAWASFTVTSSSNVLNVTDFNAVANDAGVISCTAATSGGGKLQSSNFYLYSGTTLIGRVSNLNQNATFRVYNNGTYSLQYVASDNTGRYVDKWTSVTVSLSPAHLPVQITDLNVTVNNTAGVLTCTTTTQYGGPLTASRFNLYNANNQLVGTFSSTSTKTAKLYVNSDGTYNVQAVVSDGRVWVDKWTTVQVTGFQDATQVLKVKASVKYNGNALVCTATANLSTALQSQTFVLYSVNSVTGKATEMRRLGSTNKAATFTNLALPIGNYTVQFIAYDGVTWADSWADFTVADSGLSVTNVSAVRNKSTISCKSTYTSNYSLSAARYSLYVGSVCVSTWEWNGTGNPTEHIFNVANADQITSVQYVIFNGYEWKDGWTTL